MAESIGIVSETLTYRVAMGINRQNWPFSSVNVVFMEGMEGHWKFQTCLDCDAAELHPALASRVP